MKTDKHFDQNLHMIGSMIEAGEPVMPVDLSIAKEVISLAWDRVNKMQVIRRCETCWHYKEGLCALAQVKPPEEIKAVGCEEWLIETVDPWDIPGHFEIGG